MDKKQIIYEEHIESVLIEGARRLAKSDICFEQDIDELGDLLNFYMACWFDTKAVFGLDLEKNDDQFINIYAYYDMKKRQVLHHLTIVLCDTKDDKEMAYILNEEEYQIVAEAMNAYCLKQTGKSLTDYVQSLE